MKKVLVLVATAAVFAIAAVASAQLTADSLPPNHHVHDCTVAPCVYPHLAVGFFPTMLGEPLATYLQDPAVCNDATDKALLPPTDNLSAPPVENQPLRAGVCSTSTTIVHLRSIDANDPAPDGWSGPIAPVKLSNDVTYVTYWLLTQR